MKLRCQNVKARDADDDAGRCSTPAAQHVPRLGHKVVIPRHGELKHGLHVGGGNVADHAGFVLGLH